jgi:hypothetical protein
MGTTLHAMIHDEVRDAKSVPASKTLRGLAADDGKL